MRCRKKKNQPLPTCLQQGKGALKYISKGIPFAIRISTNGYIDNLTI